MIIVTGGAGFIGSNLVKALNARGRTDVVVVDDLTDGRKFVNLAGAQLADYWDVADFRARLKTGVALEGVQVVFHQGACSDTTEWNGRYMMDINFETSKELFLACQHKAVPLVYASSAAVYGGSSRFDDRSNDEQPLNVYGWSKLMFDMWLGRHADTFTAPVAGLRYFNVYGPGEQHKGRMASVVHHFSAQIRDSGKVKLFGASHGYEPGEQRRDFVHVSDIVKVNLWAWEAGATGIFNAGTGAARPFNDVARAVIAWHGRGEIEYTPFPDDLKGAYQAFTEADISQLRSAGYAEAFASVEEGVRATLDAVAQRPG